MTTLFAVAAQYQDAAHKLADMDLDAQTIADTLEGMAGELETKAQSVAYVVRSLEADAAAVSQWAKDANTRAKALESRAESLREFLANTLQACGIQKVEGPGIKLSFRKVPVVVVDEQGLIPADYMRTPAPPEPTPDKVAIREAINGGKVVPGAHIETRMSLQIK